MHLLVSASWHTIHSVRGCVYILAHTVHGVCWARCKFAYKQYYISKSTNTQSYRRRVQFSIYIYTHKCRSAARIIADPIVTTQNLVGWVRTQEGKSLNLTVPSAFWSKLECCMGSQLILLGSEHFNYFKNGRHGRKASIFTLLGDNFEIYYRFIIYFNSF